MNKKTKKPKLKTFSLRIPEERFKELRERAVREKRSINKTIENLLEQVVLNS